MHRWAREEFRKAIGFSPDHAEARKRLGYIKSAGEWEPDPNAALETDNKKKGDAEELKVKKEYDSRIEKLGRTIGKMWGDTGNFCERSKMKAEAEAAWKKAIEYDPGNTDSRKKLLYTKQKDGPWLSKFEVGFRKELKDGLAKAPSGQPHKKETEVEADLGWKHEKRASNHFLIQVAGKDQEWLAQEVKHGEHAYAMFHKLFEVKEDLFQQPFNLIVVKDKASHEAYVDRYFTSSDAAWKSMAKKSQGVGGFPRCQTTLGERPELHDWVIHHTIEDLYGHLAGGARIWLREGLAYHFTKTMLGSALSSCTNMAGTGGGSEKNLQNADDWPLVLRTWIKDGKDPNIAEVFKCKSIAELSGPETVKAWSLVEFLVVEHRERLIEFFSKIRGQKEEEDEAMLKEVFGWTLDDFDTRWKTYARTAY